MSEPTYVTVTATCRADGCGNAGVACDVLEDPAVPLSAVFCGVCGGTIDDLVRATS